MCRDIGGSDPERMAAPMVQKYMEDLFPEGSPVKVSHVHIRVGRVISVLKVREEVEAFNIRDRKVLHQLYVSCTILQDIDYETTHWSQMEIMNS